MRNFGIGFVCATLLAFGGHATAQDFPTRQVTLVMPFAAGGPGDVIARVFGQGMSAVLGQQILVENVGGAGGTIGVARVAAARPDGYTILLHHIGMATAPAMYANLKFDPVNDFEPIGVVADNPMVFVTRKGLAVADFGAFVAYAKANAGKLTFSHAGVGSAAHLCGVLLTSAIGAEIRGVPYRGAGPALNDVISGQIDFMCDQPVNVIGAAGTGDIKALAVTSSKRQPTLPDVPTVTSFGFDNLVVTIWLGLYAPKGTPKPIVDKLSAALQAATVDPMVKERMGNVGIDVMPRERATPEALRQHLAAETARWLPLLKAAGVVPQ
jgi:tripartite-type tricarboxylate transporter receptor subunit TctC